MKNKLTEYEFVVRAIKRLRKPPYKGIHSVYSGFNQAFREYFNKDPIKATRELVEEGKIVTRPIKGGVLLYLSEDGPSTIDSKGVLKTILGGNDEPDEGLEILGPADTEGDQ